MKKIIPNLAEIYEIAVKVFEENQQYRVICIIEEIKALKEKNEPKKMCIPPCNICYKEECDCQCEHLGDAYRDAYRCPSCKSDRVYMSEYDLKYNYCPDCGQKLDWQ